MTTFFNWCREQTVLSESHQDFGTFFKNGETKTPPALSFQKQHAGGNKENNQ
ncbi:hypothetical protein [Streptococcus canis]|uniref:hypothetical protein n=1 Tax=Streptococcus canis TaxID=1329 RepID=UPI002F963AE7